MRYLIISLLLSISFSALSEDRDHFLRAWEDAQVSNAEVESFEKVSDGQYQVKFRVLPFEGVLKVLAYDVEDVGYIPKGSLFEISGYVEVELVGFSEEKLARYQRSYYKWAESNQLYLNSGTNEWVSNKQYIRMLSTSEESESDSFFWVLIEYWNYLLIAIILYFLFSQISNNKKVAESISIQKKAVDDMNDTKKAMEESAERHKETNELLRSILQVLKK